MSGVISKDVDFEKLLIYLKKPILNKAINEKNSILLQKKKKNLYSHSENTNFQLIDFNNVVEGDTVKIVNKYNGYYSYGYVISTVNDFKNVTLKKIIDKNHTQKLLHFWIQNYNKSVLLQVFPDKHDVYLCDKGKKKSDYMKMILNAKMKNENT